MERDSGLASGKPQDCSEVSLRLGHANLLSALRHTRYNRGYYNGMARENHGDSSQKEASNRSKLGKSMLILGHCVIL